MVKVGMIVCAKCDDMCWKVEDLVTKAGTNLYKELGSAQLVGCIACAGCPGKSVVNRAKLLTRCDVDIIAFSSYCRNDAAETICPYREKILEKLTHGLKTTIVVDCQREAGA